MPSTVERMTGVPLIDQGPAFLMMMGHAGTHWSTATFYLILPFLADDLGLSYTQVGQIVAVLNVSAFFANSFSGAVVDLLGRRVAVQTLALVCNAVAVFALGFSTNLLALMASVAVIGVAVNVWHPAAISFLSQRFASAKGYALSIHVLGANVGDAFAPLVTGALLGMMTWRSTAMISAVPTLAIAGILAATLLVSERRTISAANDDKMALADFRRSFRILVHDPLVLSLCALAGFRMVAMVGVLTFLPLYLRDVMAMEPLWIGTTLMLMQVGGIASSLVAGALSDHIGRRRVLVAGITVTTVAILGMIFSNSGVFLIVGVSVLGFALFGVRAVMQSWMVETVPSGLGGTGTSLMFGTQSAMATLSPILGGLIADRWGLVAVFYMLAATVMVANVFVLLMPKREKSRPLDNQ